MKKETIYKLFAIGLVALFIIEMAAIGILNSGRGSAQSSQQNGTIADAFGRVHDELTLLRYEPYLIVSGSQEQIEQAKKRLSEKNLSIYSTKMNEFTVIGLNQSNHVVEAAEEIEGLNLTVLATATLALPNTVKIESDAGIVHAKGSSFKIQLKPIYQEGSKISASLIAQVQNGQVVAVGSLIFLPTILSAEVIGKVEKIKDEFLIAEIAWEDRIFAKQIAKQEGIAFKEKSYLMVKNATPAQLAQIRNFDYVTAVQEDIISVSNDFAGKERAISDFAAVNLEPIFPASEAYFKKGENSSKFEEILKQSNVSFRLKNQTKVQILLPSKINVDGEEYINPTQNIELEIEAEMEEFKVWIEFEVSGNRIQRIIQAKPVPSEKDADN
ncbi:MAG: hypothetical protein QXN37_01370 [Candidatus Anstonellaceae archaeon]